MSTSVRFERDSRLLRILREEETVTLVLDGMRKEFVKAAARGDRKVWCDALRAWADLIECSTHN